MKKTELSSVVKFGIQGKLFLGFSTVLLLTFLVGAMGIYGNDMLYKHTGDLGKHWFTSTDRLSYVQKDTQDLRRYTMAAFMSRKDPEDLKQYIKTIDEVVKPAWEKDYALFKQTVTSAKGKELIQILEKSHTEYLLANQNIFASLQLTGKDAEAQAQIDENTRRLILKDSKVSFDLMLATIEQLMSNQRNGGNAAIAAAEVANQQIIIFIITFGSLAVLAGLIIAFLLARHISKPLVAVTGIMQAVATKDLTVNLPEIANRDEVGVMAWAVDNMLKSTRELICNVLDQASDVAAASEEISAGTEQAAAGSQVQAKETQVITEKISEMAAAAQEMAANSEQAVEVSEKTLENAEHGQKIVDAARDGMETLQISIKELGSRSEQIGEIVEVIDDIAVQTNLLALNAAIEAARAGEHGRGFAVVADEIRKLAERSSKATKEIAKLISQIQEGTGKAVQASESGARGSGEAGKAFAEIVSLVRESVAMVEQISAAAISVAELSSKSAGGVQSIAAITEEFAASSEEVAASASSLAHMSEKLRLSVNDFKI